MKPYSKCPVVCLLQMIVCLAAKSASGMASFILSIETESTPLTLKSGSNSSVNVRLFSREESPNVNGLPKFPPNAFVQLSIENPEIASIIPPPTKPASTADDMIQGTKFPGLERSMIQIAEAEQHGNSAAPVLLKLVPERLDAARNNASVLAATFVISGVFLGRTQLTAMAWTFKSVNAEHHRVPLIERPVVKNVKVLNNNQFLNHIFVGVLTILMIIANLLMGSQLQLHLVWAVLKRPFAPLIGFLCQFLIMPLIAYCFAIVVFLPCNMHALALGLFTVGCSPGGGASNFWTILLRGNVDLSVTMTFLSTVLALGLMPMWMFTAGRQFMVSDNNSGRLAMIEEILPSGNATRSLPDEELSTSISIPYKSICISLLVLVLPLLAGVLFRRLWPRGAEVVKSVLRPFICLIILFICSFGVYANLYMFRLMTWRVMLAGVALPWLGFAIAALISTALRQPLANVIAISVETGIQNSGIAIMLLKGSFPAPDGDLASVVPVMVSIFTPLPLVGVLGLTLLKKWISGEPSEKSVKNLELQDGLLEDATLDKGIFHDLQKQNSEELAFTDETTDDSDRADSSDPIA